MSAADGERGRRSAATPAVRDFYERYVEEHVPYHRSPQGLRRLLLSMLPYASYREWRFWRRWVPPGCELLDLGCARGREVFRERSRRTIGVDLALTALAECRLHYHGAALGSLAALPFPDHSFDCVVSSHVMGHIPAEAKDAVLAEACRVLRPGGRSIHLIEMDSLHPAIAIAKTQPELYQRYLIDPDGHIGLEPWPDAVERFRRNGCKLVGLEKIDAGPLHPRLVVKWFDNEYCRVSPALARKVRRSRRLLDSPALLAITEIALGAWHRTLGQWAYPERRAPFIAAVFCKDAS